MLLILLGVIVGIILPVQTSINARLQKTVGPPFVVSLITFTVGTIFLAIVTLIQIKTLLVPLTLIENQPFWIWIGGLLGVFYLTTNILLFPKMGSIQTVIMPILGQILMGLVIDQFGLFYSMESKMTVVKFLGAMFVVAGVLVAIGLKSMLEHQVSYTQKSKGLNLWRLIGLIAGMLSATESAINGHL
ncbi:DMT family transporter [Lactobacillus terrae]|uniref:DMT family transporter n=1 Tax=Lactobacillus terrae TaxID=2269374 RepID=UPI003182FB7A